MEGVLRDGDKPGGARATAPLVAGDAGTDAQCAGRVTLAVWEPSPAQERIPSADEGSLGS